MVKKFVTFFRGSEKIVGKWPRLFCPPIYVVFEMENKKKSETYMFYCYGTLKYKAYERETDFKNGSYYVGKFKTDIIKDKKLMQKIIAQKESPIIHALDALHAAWNEKPGCGSGRVAH